MSRIGFVKRWVTTKAKPSITATFEESKAQFIFDIKAIIALEEIPNSLVLNWDQTAVRYVPVSSWTMEKVGAKRVEIIGSDERRQMTALFTVSMAGDFLAPQLIYQGKPVKCHPKVNFPPDWSVTHTETHWSNESTTLEYITKILIPYLERKRKELELPNLFPALVIFDKFKG